MKVYHVSWHTHLGDVWRAVSMLFMKSEQSGESVGFQYQYPWFSETVPACSIEHYVRAIIPEMDSPGTVVPVASSSDAIYMDTNAWVPSVPTKLRWNGDPLTGRKLVCCFGGVAHAKRKLPPPGEADWFLDQVKKLGFDAYNINGTESLHDLVVRMAASDLFIGACSGPAQIAYSVGIPVCIMKYHQGSHLLDIWHGPKPMLIAHTLKELIRLAANGTGVLAGR